MSKMGLLSGTCAMAALAFCCASQAGTFELNTTRGLWQLNTSLSPYFPASQGPLVASGFSIGPTLDSRFAAESPLGVLHNYLVVANSSSPFGGLLATQTLRMPNPVGANGFIGAAFTNVWTITMDVRLPAIGSNYINLLQDSVTNAAEGEIFLNHAGQIQMFGATGPAGGDPVASNALAPNTWYRLTFTSTYDAVNSRQSLKVYVNGTVTSQTSASQIHAPRDGRYAWSTQVALFSDDNNESAPSHLGALMDRCGKL